MFQKALEMFNDISSLGIGFVVGQIINFGVIQFQTLIKIIFNKG